VTGSRPSELRGVAERIAARLPALVDEVVLTGSVSRWLREVVAVLVDAGTRVP
jgi:hypothetical protein